MGGGECLASWRGTFTFPVGDNGLCISRGSLAAVKYGVLLRAAHQMCDRGMLV